MIATHIIKNVLACALSSGADFSELFVEDKDILNISMISGRVENISASRIFGAGVRIFLGNQCIYAYSNKVDEYSLMLIAKKAANALGNLAPSSDDVLLYLKDHKEYSPILIKPGEISHKEKIELLTKASNSAKSYSSDISQVATAHSETNRRILIANSTGLLTGSEQARMRFSVQAIASSGSENQVGYEAPGYCMGFEAYKNKIDVEKLARDASKAAVTMLKAQECPGGIVPVVIDGGFGGVIFHEACGHSLESTSVSVGQSVFCDKLGQKIASSKVTAYDNGTIENAWGTIDIDDEGTPSQNNLLIENGILKNYMIDLMGSRKMNMPSTGCGRRESYKYMPASRMTNTYIAAGEDDDQEMISSLGEGLYAKSMGGGSVNPLTGEFNFAVNEGYWVKNGDLIPVRGATLIGKGAEVIMNIDRVGKDMTLGTGMCGSVSGQIPTSVGQPRIRVSALSVGGKGEKI